MRLPIFSVAALTMLSLALGAQGFPAIIFYNYTPPAPQLQLASITPQDHQEFNESPGTVSVTFSLAIDQNKSDLKVFDQYNNPVNGTRTFPKESTIILALPPHLLAGSYRIEWNATCLCNGNPVVNGSSYFTVY